MAIGPEMAIRKKKADSENLRNPLKALSNER